MEQPKLGIYRDENGKYYELKYIDWRMGYIFFTPLREQRNLCAVTWPDFRENFTFSPEATEILPPIVA